MPRNAMAHKTSKIKKIITIIMFCIYIIIIKDDSYMPCNMMAHKTRQMVGTRT